MGCSNCFNGCTDIQSDKCIKYTGVDIPSLEISNGDSLSHVTRKITDYLFSMFDGYGIIPAIEPSVICELIEQKLPTSGNISIVDISEALISTVCSLQEQIDTITEQIAGVEEDYTIGCLTGVSASSGTHHILQKLIDFVCILNNTLTALANNIEINYVSVNDIDDYIADYIASTSSTQMYSKMVPNTAVEYYGSLTYFDGTGKGTGVWDKIYLCNGQNGTPDKRGRVAVGTTTMLGGVFDAAVNPATPGNPTYAIKDKVGANTVILTATQIPSHTHIGAINTAGNHFHYAATDEVGGNNTDPVITSTTYIKRALGESSVSQNYVLLGSSTIPTVGKTSGDGTHTHTLSIANSGGGLDHPNIQPVLACHYIIYIP